MEIFQGYTFQSQPLNFMVVRHRITKKIYLQRYRNIDFHQFSLIHSRFDIFFFYDESNKVESIKHTLKNYLTYLVIASFYYRKIYTQPLTCRTDDKS